MGVSEKGPFFRPGLQEHFQRVVGQNRCIEAALMDRMFPMTFSIDILLQIELLRLILGAAKLVISDWSGRHVELKGDFMSLSGANHRFDTYRESTSQEKPSRCQDLTGVLLRKNVCCLLEVEAYNPRPDTQDM